MRVLAIGFPTATAPRLESAGETGYVAQPTTVSVGPYSLINRVAGVLYTLEEQMSEADLKRATAYVPDWEERRYHEPPGLEPQTP